jgi:modulator of FtsH protease HflC
MKPLKLVIFVVILALGVTAWKSFFIMRPDQVVVVTQFGEPVGEHLEPGAYFLIPFVQDARYLDARVRGWDDITRNTNTSELKPIDVTAFARWQIDPRKGGPTKFYTAVGTDMRAHGSMDSIVTKRIQAAIREHRLASVVRDKGRSFAAREASDLKFLFVDYPECKPNKNNEIKTMLDEYDEIAKGQMGATGTVDAKALRSEIVADILKTSNKALREEFGFEILDLHFKYLNYSPQVHAEITTKITKDRARDIARYNKVGDACTGTIRQVKEESLGSVVGERDRRVRELRGEAVADTIRIKAEAFNENPEFFRFLKMLELYENSLTQNTRFVMAADNPILGLMQDPALVAPVRQRILEKRPPTPRRMVPGEKGLAPNEKEMPPAEKMAAPKDAPADAPAMPEDKKADDRELKRVE